MPKRRSREPEFDLVEIPPVRQAIGDRVLASRREKPTFIMTVLVRGEAMIAARTKYKEEAGERVLPTFNDIIIKAIGDLLPAHRHLNAWVAEEGIRQLKPINVGFAAATPQGVVLPTVSDADQKSVWDIAPETKEMVDLARNGKLRASLQMGAGFTVSNIGPAGIDSFDAIISPPQVAILAVGSMTLRPVVDGGSGWRPGQDPSECSVVAAPAMNMSLTVDHRALDGAEAAPFLAELRDKLENWDA
ncbi:MAG TPA: 2-oxo acid dehydrogenase subunit E2 [Armatimonadota bacterium]|nr:2-oxo acid dehydrogenase subunit E2 [Armatimonadota bacterium]